MKSTTIKQQGAMLKSLYPSDFGLKSGGMTVTEVLIALDQLKTDLGQREYSLIANDVITNLRAMQPGTIFYFQRYFKGTRLKAFMVICFRYIIEHYDYEFLNDYSAIRRMR